MKETFVRVKIFESLNVLFPVFPNVRKTQDG